MKIRRHGDTAAQRINEGTVAPGERDTPGADAFVVIRASHVPWDDDAPLIREDERYERSNATEGDPLSPQDRALVDEVGDGR